MRIYSLEGNIGSGKSTLLGKLKEHYANSTRHIFVDEPVAEWVAMKDPADGLNILEKYYADQSRYGFSFQIFAYITKLRRLIDAAKAAADIPGAVLICERSLYTDRYVFAKMLHDMGKIEDINYSIYLNWYDYFIESIDASRHFIYVSTTADVCDARIRRRNRAGEEGIPLDYLQECEKYHIAMLDELATQVTSITLDGNIHKEFGDSWDTELAHISAFIDKCSDIAPAAITTVVENSNLTSISTSTSIKSLLLKRSTKIYTRDNNTVLSEEEYIEELCNKINEDFSPDVKNLWWNCVNNVSDVVHQTEGCIGSDIITEFIYNCTSSSTDVAFDDVFLIYINVRINEDKYPKYNSYTDQHYTYQNDHLLESIKTINAALMAYCTGRNINCSFDIEKQNIVITI